MVVLGLSVSFFGTLCGGYGDSDACAVVYGRCEYAERVRECEWHGNVGMGNGEVWLR